MSRRRPQNNGRDLVVARKAAELAAAAPINPVAAELAGIVGQLPTGVYRMTTTICRVEYDQAGVEKSTRVIDSHCFDFESKPGAPALPAPAAEPEDDEARS